MPPKKTTRGSGKGPSEKQVFIWAERTQESGGNYQAVNPNSGALGAYQVMPANLPGWLSDSGLPAMTDYQYLHNPDAQDRLAWHILGGYYDTYGPAGAAAMWYSGQPDPNKTYGSPPVYQYVADVLALMKSQHFPVNYGRAPGGSAFNLPPPNESDWSSAVEAAAAAHHRTARHLADYGRAIDKIR